MGNHEAHGEVSAGTPTPHHVNREATPAEQPSHLHRQRPRRLQEDTEKYDFSQRTPLHLIGISHAIYICHHQRASTMH